MLLVLYGNVSEGLMNKPGFTGWRAAELLKTLATNVALLISFWTHSKFLRMQL